MPTFLVYGFFIGLSQTLATLLMFALGFHRSAEGLAKAQMPENLVGFILLIVLVGLAYRAARKQAAARGAEPTLGGASKLAALTALFAALVTGAGQYVYRAAINRTPAEIMTATALKNAEPYLAPLSAEEAATQKTVIEFFNSPLFTSVVYVINVFFFTLLLGIAYAWIFRAAVRRDEAAAAR